MFLLFADLRVHALASLGREEHSITLRDKSDDAEVLMFVVDDAPFNSRASA
jgi:hypothetical protein